MKAKVFFLIVASALFCLPMMADDIYYNYKKSAKSAPNNEVVNASNISPEEFQKRLREFTEESQALMLSNIEENSTMDKLIRKKWYEFNPLSMQLSANYYTFYTTSYRIIVGIDENGNVSERMQKYYLSNKYEASFDSTKVGVANKGKYIVVQGKDNPTRATCLNIGSISDSEMNTIEEIGDSKLQKFYIADADDLAETKDMLPSEMLLNKTWLQVDENSNAPTRYEYHFQSDGYMEKCVMGENRRTDFPYWLIGEYYFSNEPDTTFIYSKKEILNSGKYLVHQIKENGVKYLHTYEVKSIAPDTMLLKCVHPADGENMKLVSVAKHAADTTSVLDKLVGKQWRRQQDRYDRVTQYRTSYSGAKYFTENQYVGPWIKTADNNYIGKDEFIYHDFYLSDIKIDRFVFENTKKKIQNGRYIISSCNGNIWAGNLEILYISERMLVLGTINGRHTYTYICD